MSVNPGDIVGIVLDVVHVSDSQGEHERVLVQGVFPRGAAQPPLREGAHRNVVEVFFGRNMGSLPAFLIHTGLTAEGQLDPALLAARSAKDGEDGE